jgi:hypothetical protein
MTSKNRNNFCFPDPRLSSLGLREHPSAAGIVAAPWSAILLYFAVGLKAQVSNTCLTATVYHSSLYCVAPQRILTAALPADGGISDFGRVKWVKNFAN